MADMLPFSFIGLVVAVFLSWSSYKIIPSTLALQGFVDNEGLCSQNKTVHRLRPLRVWETHYETYSSRCGFLFLNTCTKTRVVGHWTTQSVIQQEEVVEQFCCEGYREEGGRCIPVCEGGCEGGLCVAPDHCACLGGYIRVDTSPNAPCLPHCTKPCSAHQRCVQPDTCACDHGYTLHGAEEFCEPVCDPPCVNADCSAPNICSCLEGYEKNANNSSQCNPICTISCKNGFCSEPEVCSCNIGFEKDENNSNLCTPLCPKKCKTGNCSSENICICLENYKLSEEDPYKCDPVCDSTCFPHASCVAPNQCECDKGYKSNEHHPETCDPVCSKNCENGMCIAPEECTCLTYYELSKQDPYTCVPVCKDECVNGYCSSPQECTCNEGFRKVSENGSMCEPVCDQDCMHGKCTGPNICSCSDGYETDLLNPFACKPICSKACLNSNCSGPETCTCYAGYEPTPTDSHVCQPACSQTCVNANCSDPNVCTCHAGFVRDNSNINVCIPLCSTPCQNGTCTAPNTCSCLEGFKQDSDNPYKCDPLCENECINSVCSSRNVCTCLKGYVPDKTDKNKCNPVCSKQCQHGVCSAPEKCICDAGYKEEEKDPFNCLPHCDKTCVNGKCTSPNHCECYENHEPDQELPHICNALCRDGCTNGICVIPDTCICMDGYHFTGDNSNMCEPICSSCKKGKCDAPDVCKCNEGYRNPSGNNSTCEPVCSQPCHNGFCSAPNVCSCALGYNKDENQSCSPYCSNGCINGKCTSPEVCECLPGYLSDKKSKLCKPICNEECVNGTCSAPDSCSCLWGFTNNNDKPNTCFAPEPDFFSCSFNMNYLTTHKSEECYSTDYKLKLKDVSNCVFLNSLIHKYLSNQTHVNNILYGVKLNCSLDYLSMDSYNESLAMVCSIENVFNINSVQDNMFNDLENEELGSESDFRYQKLDAVIHRNSKATENIEVHPIGIVNEGLRELGDGEESEKPNNKPIIYEAPLIPQIPLDIKNIPPIVLKQQPTQASITTDKEKKAKPNSEYETAILPAITKTLQNVAFDIWKKKKEPEADNLSDDFYQRKISNSPLGQRSNEKEYEGKVKIQTHKKDASKGVVSDTTNILINGTSSFSSESTKVGSSQLNDSKTDNHTVSELHSGDDHSKEEDNTDLQMIKVENQVPIVIKMDTLPFIKTGGITSDYFNGLLEPIMKEEWCLCFKDTLKSLCVGDSNFKVTLCRCSSEIEELPLDIEEDAQKLYLLPSMMIAVVVIILISCILCFVVRRCRKKSKEHALTRQDLNGKQNGSQNNSLHLHINANCPAEDPDTTSSKL